MIYTPVPSQDPICQGDIFYKLPFLRFDLKNLQYINSDHDVVQGSWNEKIEDNTWILANVQKVYAIVLTEDCDCIRNPYISFILITPWNKKCENAKTWMQEIININTKGLTGMYLPPDPTYQMNKRMLIDFATIFHIDRDGLKQMLNLRLCRLNEEAKNHFRDKISHYFKRYAYEEYYPLNSEEMDQYVLKNQNSEEKFHRKSYQIEKTK